MSTKEVQGKLWSIAPQYWSKHFEPLFLPLYKKALEQLSIKKNTLLLDAGCGAGLFSRMAIAAGAELIGVDAAPGLLEIARKRNPQNNFLREDIEALPFASDSFHIVTAFNSLQYAGDFTAALSEAKRVLKPGGKIVIGIWDKPEYCEATSILKAVISLLPPPPEAVPEPFVLSEDGKIEDICNTIGLKVIYQTRVACPFLYSKLEDGTRSFMGTAPAANALNYITEKKLRQTVASAFAPYRLTENIHYLQNSFILLIAEK